MCDGVLMSQLRSTEAIAGRQARRWLLTLPLLALLGLADSGYLLWQHRTAISAFCPARGCDLVNQGEYSEIGGIPLAAIGVVAYLLLFALAVVAMTLSNRRVLEVMLVIAGIGVAASAWLVYLQVAVIESICSWCVLSAFTMTSIFVLILSALLTGQSPQQSKPANHAQLRQRHTEVSRHPVRFPLMALGMIALLAAMLGGLFRLGWDWPPIPSTLSVAHGPLMVSGFLGTLIGLERAVWPLESGGPLSDRCVPG